MAHSPPPVTMVASTRLNCRHLSSPPCASSTASSSSDIRISLVLAKNRHQRAQFLQRSCGFAAWLGAVHDDVVSTGIGRVEPVAVQVEFPHLRVPQVVDAQAIAHLGAVPKL